MHTHTCTLSKWTKGIYILLIHMLYMHTCITLQWGCLNSEYKIPLLTNTLTPTHILTLFIHTEREVNSDTQENPQCLHPVHIGIIILGFEECYVFCPKWKRAHSNFYAAVQIPHNLGVVGLTLHPKLCMYHIVGWVNIRCLKKWFVSCL